MHIEIFETLKDIPQLATGSPFHSIELFRMISSSGDANPFMFVCFKDGKAIAHLLTVRRREFRLIPFGIYTWYSIYGEGVYCEECNKEKIFSLFIEKLFQNVDYLHTFIEIRNLSDRRFAYKTLSEKEFYPVKCLRIYNSLHSRSPQERLSRSYRSYIKKAEERGVTFGKAMNVSEIEAGLRLLRNYYTTKIRRHFPNMKAMYTLLTDGSNSAERAQLFIVRYKDKIIGSSICLYEKGRAYLAYSCGLRKRYPLLYPGIVSIWAAITDAHSHGYSHFEFSESNLLSRNYSGYINTVLNFGGKQASTTRWFHFKWRWLNKILRAIYV